MSLIKKKAALPAPPVPALKSFAEVAASRFSPVEVRDIRRDAAAEIKGIGKRRAPNGSVTDATRVRFTPAQLEKLKRMSDARGVSVAEVLRSLVEACS